MTPPDSGEREVPCEHGFNGPCPAPPRRKPRDGIRLPLSLAQRILAALEECGEVVGPGIIFPRHTALADELRAIVERKT